MKDRLTKSKLRYLEFECDDSADDGFESFWIKVNSYCKLCLGFYDNQRFASECHLISFHRDHQFPIRLPKTVEDLNLLYFSLSGKPLEY